MLGSDTDRYRRSGNGGLMMLCCCLSQQITLHASSLLTSPRLNYCDLWKSMMEVMTEVLLFFLS